MRAQREILSGPNTPRWRRARAVREFAGAAEVQVAMLPRRLQAALDLRRQGLMAWEIGQRLGIRERAATRLLQAARSELGVERERLGASQRAALRRLVGPELAPVMLAAAERYLEKVKE